MWKNVDTEMIGWSGAVQAKLNSLAKFNVFGLIVLTPKDVKRKLLDINGYLL